jgi:hypothetical protein
VFAAQAERHAQHFELKLKDNEVHEAASLEMKRLEKGKPSG